MATTFAFIDYFNIHRKSRRTIRSHVMKGKNVGKVRVPKKRPSHVAKDRIAHNLDISLMDRRDNHSEALPGFFSQQLDASDRPKNSPKLIVQVGKELSSLMSPHEITPQSRRSIHNCESSTF